MQDFEKLGAVYLGKRVYTKSDKLTEDLVEVVLRAKSTDIHVPLVGVAWRPYQADDKGRLRSAW